MKNQADIISMNRRLEALLGRSLRSAEGYLNLGMPDEAMEELDALPAVLQAIPDVQHYRVRSLLIKHQWSDAFKLTDSVLVDFPERADFYFMKACALDQGGYPQKAKDVLMGIPVFFHDTDIFHLNLARFEAELGNRDTAREHITRAIEINDQARSIVLGDPTLRACVQECPSEEN